MITVALLLLAVTIWLIWEWRTGALAPAADRAGRRLPGERLERSRTLPTSASLNVDAAVVARADPPVRA